jgi:hypothetical protein
MVDSPPSIECAQTDTEGVSECVTRDEVASNVVGQCTLYCWRDLFGVDGEVELQDRRPPLGFKRVSEQSDLEGFGCQKRSTAWEDGRTS